MATQSPPRNKGSSNRSGGAPFQISKHLKGIHFPADKDTLLERCRKNGAPDEIMRAVQAMPDREYGSMAEVMKGYAGKRGA